MKINNIIYQSTSLNRENKNYNKASRPQVSNNSVNFTGIGKLDPRNLGRLDPLANDILKFASNILELEPKVVNDTIRKSSKPQKHFLSLLVEKFNCDNFYKPDAEKENGQVVLDLVKKVQFPTDSHFRFAYSRTFRVTDVADAMKKLNYSAPKISKFMSVSRDIKKYNNASSTNLVSILHSEHGDKYVREYSTYEPYLKRHLHEKDAIKNLDEMVKNGTYDAVKERQIFELEKRTKHLQLDDVVDVDKLFQYSSKESNSMLTILSRQLSHSRLKDTSNYSKNLAEIYSTTTKENVQARARYLYSYSDILGVHEYHKNEMDNITKLFKRMDEEPEVMNFVTKISKPESNKVGAAGILRVIDAVPPKKRELYSENIASILAYGKEDSVDKAIRFCALQPESAVGKAKKGLKQYVMSLFSPKHEKHKYKLYMRNLNKLNAGVVVSEADKPETISLTKSFARQTKSENLPVVAESQKTTGVVKPAYKQPVLPRLSDIINGTNRIKFNIPTPVVAQGKAVTAERPKIDTLPAVIYDIPKIDIPSAPAVVKSTDLAKEMTEKVDKVAPKKINRGIYTNRPTKQPSAQKLQVISDVNNLIEKKLGKNTLADQSKSYEHGANKMKLSVLPEIFESIKETRAQKRVAGTFSRTKSESNADALTLFNMINGRNKRLVNYMLKVRNADGQRIYSVKDIISTVGETEKSIRMSKLSKETRISPSDAKAMYTTMLDEQIAQYGKLPRAKAKKK